MAPIEIFLIFLACAGVPAILVGVAFPIYMYATFGLSYADYYENGHLSGHVQYLSIGIAFGLLSIMLGTGIYKLARFYLDLDK